MGTPRYSAAARSSRSTRSRAKRPEPPRDDPEIGADERPDDGEADARKTRGDAICAAQRLSDRDESADEHGDDDRGARPDSRERAGDEEDEAGFDAGIVRPRVDQCQPQPGHAREREDDRGDDDPHGRSSILRSVSAPSSRVRWYAA